MKNTYNVVIALISILALNCCKNPPSPVNKMNTEDMMIRIAEVELYADYLDEYTAVLKEESEASIRLETGVLCIFPMLIKDNPTSVRLLEIYANRASYESHLKTPHFLKYKTTTLKMVKSLRLVDMASVDAESMPMIFRKVSE